MNSTRQFFLFAVSSVILGLSPVVHAQTLPVPGEKVEEKVNAAPAISVPRVFSSRLEKYEEAAKMDEAYHNLRVSLWNAAQVDKVHHKKLLDLMIAEKFQYSRREVEFKPALDMAMKDLNRNYKSFDDQMSAMDEQFVTAIEKMAPEDQEIAQNLWADRKAEIITSSDDYFKSQAKFLKSYKKLVNYILQDSNRYYYDSTRKRVSFYNVGEYTFFGETLDALNKIAYNQKIMMRSFEPQMMVQ